MIGRPVRARTRSTSAAPTATASAPAASASSANAPTSPTSAGMIEIPSPSEMAWLKRLMLRCRARALTLAEGDGRSRDPPQHGHAAHDGRRIGSSHTRNAGPHEVTCLVRAGHRPCRFDPDSLWEALTKKLEIPESGAARRRGGSENSEIGVDVLDDPTGQLLAGRVEHSVHHGFDEDVPATRVEAGRPGCTDDRCEPGTGKPKLTGEHQLGVERNVELSCAGGDALPGPLHTRPGEDGGDLHLATAEPRSRRAHVGRGDANGGEVCVAGLVAEACCSGGARARREEAVDRLC